MTAGQNIRKLVKDGYVIKKPQVVHSRARARREAEAKAKGRHSGYGGCRGGCTCSVGAGICFLTSASSSGDQSTRRSSAAGGGGGQGRQGYFSHDCAAVTVQQKELNQW
jgi:hypothetical protein